MVFAFLHRLGLAHTADRADDQFVWLVTKQGCRRQIYEADAPVEVDHADPLRQRAQQERLSMAKRLELLLRPLTLRRFILHSIYAPRENLPDGGAPAHALTTPALASTYTASFTGTSGGSGLQATYFDNIDFTGARVARTDVSVNFNWGTGAPATGIGPNTFSVRWLGQVMPQYSQTYTFYTTSDDGVRL